ncbi:hypothetical protein pEaSNUABM13_00320 [Erwinia phage pEa_SNUABM_13]|nr:hypothetical protein pEaSNUABM13_00320 [Erwinia phage pEa_SNUABM_13]
MKFDQAPTKAQLVLLALALESVLLSMEKTFINRNLLEQLLAKYGISFNDLKELREYGEKHSAIGTSVAQVMEIAALNVAHLKTEPKPEYSQDDLDLIRVEYEPIDTSVLRQGAVNDGVITVQQAATFERDQILTAILEYRLRSEA